MIAVDTSVAIAALSPWHDRHADAADVCREDAALPAHALLECYSTLTRMPEPLRISGAVAAHSLERAWGTRILVPPAHLITSLPSTLGRASVEGGSSYDGLVGLTAMAHSLPLVSLDVRAERTYRALGIDYRLIA